MKPIFLKPEFVMTQQDIETLDNLPDNSPHTKLTKKQINQVKELYYKYIARPIENKTYIDFCRLEMSEKWPTGPRVKRHEAMRMILGWLAADNKYKKQMSFKEAAECFYRSMTARPAAVKLTTFIYNIENCYKKD